MQQTEAIQMLGALAHPIRLDVFRQLVQAGPSGLTPGVLVEALHVPSAKLSFHLKELTLAGLVSSEAVGRYLIYRAAFDSMNALLTYLTENCCRGADCEPMLAGACGSPQARPRAKGRC